MSEKIELSYQEAFLIAHALSEIFEEKMDGKTAAFLYRFSRPFKTLVDDYNASCALIDREDEKEIIKINTSPFCEVEKFSISLLEGINIKPSTIVKLDKVLSI